MLHCSDAESIFPLTLLTVLGYVSEIRVQVTLQATTLDIPWFMLLPQFSLLNLALLFLLFHYWRSNSDHDLHSYPELFSSFFFVLYWNTWGHHSLSLMSHKLKVTRPLGPPFLSHPGELSSLVAVASICPLYLHHTHCRPPSCLF